MRDAKPTAENTSSTPLSMRSRVARIALRDAGREANRGKHRHRIPSAAQQPASPFAMRVRTPPPGMRNGSHGLSALATAKRAKARANKSQQPPPTRRASRARLAAPKVLIAPWRSPGPTRSPQLTTAISRCKACAEHPGSCRKTSAQRVQCNRAAWPDRHRGHRCSSRDSCPAPSGRIHCRKSRG